MTNWYNLPVYYDVSFSHEMQAECRFLETIIQRYVSSNHPSVLEPACGTGRLLMGLLKSGINCSGMDINPYSLNYFNKKLIRNQLSAEIIEADMSAFKLSKKYDAAFCTVDTFRHLLSEKQAFSHLRCMAKALKNGAVYIIGMHLVTENNPGVVTTRWVHRRGQLTVKTIMKALGYKKKKRRETLEVIIKPETKQRKLESHQSIYDLRTYTLKQFRSLISKSKQFTILEAYDEYYDYNHPIKLSDKTDYAVFILQRL